MGVVAGVPRQPRQDVTRPFVNPDVVGPFSDLQCEAAAIRSEPQIPPVGVSGAQRRCLAVTIEPLNVDALCHALAGEVDERAGVRYGELRHASVGVGHHVSNHGNRWSGGLEPVQIERPREERPVLDVHDVATRQIAPVEAAGQNRLALARGKRLYDQACLVVTRVRNATAGEQHSPASGQELRPTLRGFAFDEGAYANGRSTVCRNPDEAVVTHQRDDDRTIVCPRRPAAAWSRCHVHGRTARHRDFLQPAAGQEADPASVGRKERRRGAFGAGDRGGVEVVEAPHVDSRRRRRVFLRHERDLGAVAGHRQHGCPGYCVDGQSGTQQRADPNRDRGRGFVRSTAPKQQHQSRHRECGGHGPRQHALPRRCRRLWFRRACVSLSGNEPLDLHAGIADRLQPAFRILFQAPPQQRMQLRWKRFRESAPVGRILQHRRQRVRNRRFVEEPASRNHLEQYDPERPDVGAPVGDVSAHLLGCHVCSRTRESCRRQ